MAKVTRECWLREARQILVEDGFGKLTLGNLLVRLGVSHGSFYHHFKNRQALTEAVLKQWRKEMTQDVVEESSQIVDVREKTTMLITMGRRFHNQTRLENAFRAQARIDPLVEKYVAEVDELRVQNCTQLAGEIFGESPRATIMGKLAHAIFVGSQQMLPPVSEQESEAMYGEFLTLISEMKNNNDKGSVLS